MGLIISGSWFNDASWWAAMDHGSFAKLRIVPLRPRPGPDFSWERRCCFRRLVLRLLANGIWTDPPVEWKHLVPHRSHHLHPFAPCCCILLHAPCCTLLGPLQAQGHLRLCERNCASTLAACLTVQYDILRPDNPGWNTGLPPSLSFPRLDFAPKNLAELLAKSNPLGNDLPLDAQDMGWYSFLSMWSIVEPLRVGMFRIEGWHGMKSCCFEGTPWNAHSFWKIWRCASIPDQRSPIAGSDVCSGAYEDAKAFCQIGAGNCRLQCYANWWHKSCELSSRRFDARSLASGSPRGQSPEQSQIWHTIFKHRRVLRLQEMGASQSITQAPQCIKALLGALLRFSSWILPCSRRELILGARGHNTFWTSGPALCECVQPGVVYGFLKFLIVS